MRLSNIKLISGIYALFLKANPTGFTANKTWLLPPTTPTNGQVLQVSSVAGNVVTLDFGTVSGGGGGTVNSVAVAAPTDTFTVSGSPITSTGTITLAYASQSPNLVHASPASGGAGLPIWRALVAADIPNIDAAKITSGSIAVARLPVGTSINTIAAGNDSRFHNQGTDPGTTAASFQLNSLATGVRIKDVAGVLQVRNAADTAFADLSVNNLIVSGTTTTVNSEVVEIADNELVLNSNVTTGTPTENLGLRGLRGAQQPAILNWIEGSLRWFAGTGAASNAIALKAERTFVAADLVTNILTFTHNLNTNNIFWMVYDNNGDAVIPDVNSVATNQATFDFTDVTITGTWRVVVVG